MHRAVGVVNGRFFDDRLEMSGRYIERLLRQGKVEALDVSSGVGFQASSWD